MPHLYTANPARRTGAYPPDFLPLQSRAAGRRAAADIATWPGFAVTSLHDLKGLAATAGLGAVYYKDESSRFGLGSFKALGGADAVLRLLQDHVAAATRVTPDSITGLALMAVRDRRSRV